MAARFTPKNPVELNPPKDDPITVEELAKADGMRSLLSAVPLLLGTKMRKRRIWVWSRESGAVDDEEETKERKLKRG